MTKELMLPIPWGDVNRIPRDKILYVPVRKSNLAGLDQYFVKEDSIGDLHPLLRIINSADGYTEHDITGVEDIEIPDEDKLNDSWQSWLNTRGFGEG